MIFFYLLISVMPLARHPLWGRFVGQLTVVKYLGAACLLYAILHMAVRQKPPPLFSTLQARLFILYYLIVTTSYLGMPSSSSPWELSPFLSYTSFFVLFLVTLAIVDSLERLRWVLLVVVGSVAFASLYVLREWQKFHSVYRDFRPGWVVGDPNYFTVSALCAMPVAFYLLLERRSRWERFYCFGCLTLTILAVMVAASRGGFLGLLTAFLFVIWRSAHRRRNLVIATIILLPIIVLAPSSPVRRLLRPSRGDDRSAETRVELWKAGLAMVRDHPLTGAGLGSFKPLVPEYSQVSETEAHIAHNSYVEIAAEMGIPAMICYVGIIGLSLRSLERLRRQLPASHPSLFDEAALGLQAGLLGPAVAILFVSGQYQKLFWLNLFLSMCLPRIAAQAQPEGAGGDSGPPGKGPTSIGTQGAPGLKSEHHSRAALGHASTRPSNPNHGWRVPPKA